MQAVQALAASRHGYFHAYSVVGLMALIGVLFVGVGVG